MEESFKNEVDDSYYLAQDISYTYEDVKAIQSKPDYDPENLIKKAQTIKKLQENKHDKFANVRFILD